MTTTDTDALTERIARAAATSEGFGPDQPDHEVVVGEYLSDARFLAPFIAEEVRKAKAEAWDEGYFIGYGEGIGELAEEDVPNNPYDATEHETGDSDEHR